MAFRSALLMGFFALIPAVVVGTLVGAFVGQAPAMMGDDPEGRPFGPGMSGDSTFWLTFIACAIAVEIIGLIIGFMVGKSHEKRTTPR